MTTLRERVEARLPDWLVEKVPRDHLESDAAFRRRRLVVAGVSLAGAGLLGISLSTEPDSTEFYVLTFGVAGTWVAGGLASGPLHLGRISRHESLVRPVLVPVLTGVAAFGAFYAAALVAREIPVLERALSSVLQYAKQGSGPLVALTTLTNGAAEEVFFRGALYAAMGEQFSVPGSTLGYVLATTSTRNPALILASIPLGLLFAMQRRASGGIQSSVITHVVWSSLMLRYLPPLFRDTEPPPSRLPGLG